jgi:integrase
LSWAWPQYRPPWWLSHNSPIRKLGVKQRSALPLWVRLREKGGKPHAMPCYHSLGEYLSAYLDQTGIMEDEKGSIFRTIGRGTDQLTRTPPSQANAAMIRRRAAVAGIATKIGNHSFRAAGVTACLKNGGTVTKAAQMANHASTRTTQLYDRRCDELSFDGAARRSFVVGAAHSFVWSSIQAAT